jgi:hypothetical protein
MHCLYVTLGFMPPLWNSLNYHIEKCAPFAVSKLCEGNVALNADVHTFLSSFPVMVIA